MDITFLVKHKEAIFKCIAELEMRSSSSAQQTACSLLHQGSQMGSSRCYNARLSTDKRLMGLSDNPEGKPKQWKTKMQTIICVAWLRQTGAACHSHKMMFRHICYSSAATQYSNVLQKKKKAQHRYLLS